MIRQLETGSIRNLTLAFFDTLVCKLLDNTALHAHQMVVVLGFGNLKHGVTTFKMVAFNQSSVLKLGQHPVNGANPDLVIIDEQLFVNVFSREVMGRRTFENLEDLYPWQGDFEAGVPEFL
tara:strand:+ start:260 stop:622 length:363 start_codon:yes stop_codon:yes gene_type:complete